MDVVEKIMGKVLQFVPDKEVDPLISKDGYVGRPMDRVDAELKVTGGALFSAEYKLEGLCCAELVYSTIARGKIKKLNNRKG